MLELKLIHVNERGPTDHLPVWAIGLLFFADASDVDIEQL